MVGETWTGVLTLTLLLFQMTGLGKSPLAGLAALGLGGLGPTANAGGLNPAGKDGGRAPRIFSPLRPLHVYIFFFLPSSMLCLKCGSIFRLFDSMWCRYRMIYGYGMRTRVVYYG